MRETPRSVFLDPSGRRWRTVQRATLAAGVVTTFLAAVVVAGMLLPPLLPGGTWTLDPTAPARLPKFAVTRTGRERDMWKKRLQGYARAVPAPPALRPSRLPLQKWAGPARSKAPDEPIVAGFFVNWDDNSFTSLKAHAERMDWVICEWAFVAPSGDSLTFKLEPKVWGALSVLPPESRPQVFVMISNAKSRTQFDEVRLRNLLTRPAARARVAAQLVDLVTRFGLGGVTIDLEGIPVGLEDEFIALTRTIRRSMKPLGRLTTQALAPVESPDFVRRVAAENDYVIMMLYDEHSGPANPGAVAGQAWYVDRAQQALASIPPGKAILGIGAYGYDWNDAGGRDSSVEQTFQDVMRTVREKKVAVRVDAATLNPYLAWSDPDSTDHVTWYLDATTAWNQIRAGARLGAAGHAIWRLGSEDPSLWSVLSKHGLSAAPDSMAALPGGYDVEFSGDGEVLRLTSRPTAGRRLMRVDPATGLIVEQEVQQASSPYVVRRTGSSPPGAQSKKVALTFDDGPDGSWTSLILDTLRSRHVPATFFVIGRNVERHIPLMRQIVREGHEFGNHTYSHPNLALVSDYRVRLEIAAAGRLLEAVLDKRSVFFRPPYFGDAEPTTADELVPVGLASDMGYITAGVHVDSDDWQNPGSATIIRSTLDNLHRGNVVLLHDGGGDRSQTVAAIGPLIDSLHARGDTLVLLSDLAGVRHDQAIVDLPPRTAATRMIELASFGLLGFTEWLVYWVFMLAVGLGVARLVIVMSLALWHRFARRPVLAGDYTPAVSVIVPAYHEARVIVATVDSLLAQDYPGPVQILVVDDGSPDDTFDVAQRVFGSNPRVAIYSKANGGKASALTHGVGFATGEIIVCLDADTVFATDTVRRLVAPLADPTVGAVAGNAKVGNRINLVTRWQALEYVTSQNLDRRAFSVLDCITVVPGAVGAWRKDLVAAAGGFSDDTLAEDQDLTLAISRSGHTIAYADCAVAYTEAPHSLRTLAKQRFRWAFGTLQCAWKHRDALFRPRYGALGFIALPNVWIFQLLFAAISPIADLMFVWSLVSVYMIRLNHGATYANPALYNVMFYYAVFLLVDWLAAVGAFLMEPGEERSLTWLILIQRLAYRQIMYWVVVKSFAAALRGQIVGWGKLERKATVELPA